MNTVVLINSTWMIHVGSNDLYTNLTVMPYLMLT